MDRKENSAPECHPGRKEQKPADPEHQKCGSKMQPDVDPMIDSGPDLEAIPDHVCESLKGAIVSW
jgi:hypothetical protein